MSCVPSDTIPGGRSTSAVSHSASAIPRPGGSPNGSPSIGCILTKPDSPVPGAEAIGKQLAGVHDWNMLIKTCNTLSSARCSTASWSGSEVVCCSIAVRSVPKPLSSLVLWISCGGLNSASQALPSMIIVFPSRESAGSPVAAAWPGARSALPPPEARWRRESAPLFSPSSDRASVLQCPR